MKFLYVFLTYLVFFAERSEASFEHGHGFGDDSGSTVYWSKLDGLLDDHIMCEYGHAPMVAAASPLYYAAIPTYHSFSGFGYGGFFPFKHRKAARRNRNSHRKH